MVVVVNVVVSRQDTIATEVPPPPFLVVRRVCKLQTRRNESKTSIGSKTNFTEHRLRLAVAYACIQYSWQTLLGPGIKVRQPDIYCETLLGNCWKLFALAHIFALDPTIFLLFLLTVSAYKEYL